jgi:peptidyl-tRNA hydrolase, PTH1 family
MKLLAGLGNPGKEYARHRHNVGFMALDAIADRHGFSPWKKRFSGLTADGEIDGQRALLLKPETYMNESGRSVGEALRFVKLTVADLIVFHDELDIDPGRLKVKTGGGNAGHNGLRSITHLVGNDYIRVRIGIGHPGHKDAVSGYVLHDFAKAERVWLDPLLDEMARAAGFLAAGKPDQFLAAVTRATTPADEPAPPARAKPASADAPASPAKSGHPAGERASKQKSALAENLRKWMEGKK